MNTIRKICLLSCILYASIIKAQTADEIINKHITAIGGQKVINKITSQIMNAEMSLMGVNVTAVTTLVTGKAFKYEVNFGGQEIIQCFTPTSGWTKNEIAGQNEPEPLPDDQVKLGQFLLRPGGDLANYKANGAKVEFAGTASEQGVNAYKIKLTGSNGKQVSYFFIHPKTYYIIKQEIVTDAEGKKASRSSIFTGHTKTDIGLVVPFTTTSNNEGTEMILSITKIEFNKTIDMKIFDLPDY